MDNWISPKELRRIADIADSCQGLWDALTTSEGVLAECDDFNLTVFDANGTRLGNISWGDGGPAFFPDMEEL